MTSQPWNSPSATVAFQCISKCTSFTSSSPGRRKRVCPGLSPVLGSQLCAQQVLAQQIAKLINGAATVSAVPATMKRRRLAGFLRPDNGGRACPGDGMVQELCGVSAPLHPEYGALWKWSVCLCARSVLLFHVLFWAFVRTLTLTPSTEISGGSFTVAEPCPAQLYLPQLHLPPPSLSRGLVMAWLCVTKREQ